MKYHEASARTVRISIVDDEREVREVLARWIATLPGFLVVRMYGSGVEALEGIPLNPPDVLLLDLVMPRMSGFECARRLDALAQRPKLIFMSGYAQMGGVEAGIHFRAASFLTKPFKLEELKVALQVATDDGIYMSPGAAKLLVGGEFSGPSDPRCEALSRLTRTEVEVLSLYRSGFRYKEIADKLGCRPGTVDTHMSVIRAKLQVHSGMNAARIVFGGSNAEHQGE